MIELYYVLRTNISDLYFEDDKSNKDFYAWINGLNELFSTRIAIEPVNFDGINGVELYVNEIDEDHNVEAVVAIDAEGLTRDDIVFDDAFITAVEGNLIPQFIKEFNRTCELSFPTKDGDFNDFMFKENEFYLRVATTDYIRYDTSRISVLQLQLTGEFEENF